LIKASVELLADELHYEVVGGSEPIDMCRLPALPRHGFSLRLATP
jgi:hypothetical protein